jgi:hypothetical protein
VETLPIYNTRRTTKNTTKTRELAPKTARYFLSHREAYLYNDNGKYAYSQ